MLGRIRGNEAFKQSVQAALQAGRLSNSVLLCAEEGCGAGFAARCLAADFLFPEGGAAAEAVLAGRSSECIEVRGQGQRGEILVGQARQVRSLARRRYKHLYAVFLRQPRECRRLLGRAVRAQHARLYLNTQRRQLLYARLHR